VLAHSEILKHEPDWHQGQQASALIDADTGKPFVLTAHERELCLKAMDGVPDTEGLMIYHSTVEHLRRGEQIQMGDVIFLNRPLMAVQALQYHLSDADVVIVKALLERLRKSASKMVGTP